VSRVCVCVCVCVCMCVCVCVAQSGLANAVLIGNVNIRQLRVKAAESCQQFHSSRCYSPFYSEASRDNSTFGTHRSFHYHTAEDTGAAVCRGQFGLYGGDGYLWSFPAGIERYDLIALLSIFYGVCEILHTVY